MKWVFKRQDLQMFGRNLNKLQVGENLNQLTKQENG